MTRLDTEQPGRLTPAERRARARALFARRARRHVDRLDLLQADIAAETGHTATAVSQWLDPAGRKNMGAAELLYLTPVALTDAMVDEYLASRDRRAVDLPKPADAATDLRAAADAQRETSEAIAAHLEACADGVMTRAEGADLVREVDEAIAALLAIRARAELAQQEGVLGLTLVEEAG